MSNNLSVMLTACLQGRHWRPQPAGPTGPVPSRGMAGWQDYYAGKQIDQLVRARSRSAVTGEIASTLRVARIAPQRPVGTARPLNRGAGAGVAGGAASAICDAPHLSAGSSATTEASLSIGTISKLSLRPTVRTCAGGCWKLAITSIRAASVGTVSNARRPEPHEGHPETTFVGDLGDGEDLPSDAFDCIVLTQTLHLAFRHAERGRDALAGAEARRHTVRHGSLDQPDRPRRVGQRLVLVDQPRAPYAVAERIVSAGQMSTSAHYGNVLPRPPSSTASPSTNWPSRARYPRSVLSSAGCRPGSSRGKQP